MQVTWISLSIARGRRTTDFDIRPEDHVPETVGDAEIAPIVEMMMEHVAPLQAIGVGAGLDMPMVKDVVDTLEAEVAEHRSRGEAGRGRRTDDKPRGEDKENGKRAKAYPDRGAEQCILFIVMRLMHFLDVRHVVKHVAVQDVLDQCPEPDPRDERRQPDDAPLR